MTADLSAGIAQQRPDCPDKPFTYTVPDWFISDNVNTCEQLQSAKPGIGFSSSPKETDSKPETGHDKQGKENTFRVCRETFSAAKDTLAALLVPDGQGQLASHSNGAIIQCGKDEAPAIMAAFVHELARELRATLVTLTLDDFHALAVAYEDQTPEEWRQDSPKDYKEDCFEDPVYLQSFRLMFRYFGSKGSDDKAKMRMDQAFDSLINLPERYSQGEKVTTVRNGAEDTNPATPADQPLIIHISDTEDFVENRGSHGRQILGKLQDYAATARKAGKPVAIVATQGSSRGPLHAVSNKLQIPLYAAFSLNYVRIPSALRKKKTSSPGLSQSSVRDLKFLLRYYTRQYFDPNLLTPKAAWPIQLESEGIDFDEDEHDLLTAIALQITGRAFVKQQLGLEDVADVVRQVSLSRRKEGGDASDESSDDESEDSGDDQCRDDAGSGAAESQTTDAGTADDGARESDAEFQPPSRDEMNKYEESLVSSIVNIKDLQATKYEDVILNEDIKGIMKQLIVLSKTKIETKSSLLAGLQIKGALLYGPPGTGKTHFSRAIANCLGSNMLALDSASLQSQYVGETEKYISAAFSLARKYRPCILFFDEVDALFYRRASSDRSWQRAALTQFLQEMDGLSNGPDAPFVLVATNRPMDLDDAFMRRLPQKILFDLPDEGARAKILRVLLSEKDLDTDVSIETLTASTKGYSGSDLKNLCSEAALLWMMELAQKDAEKPDETGQGWAASDGENEATAAHADEKLDPAAGPSNTSANQDQRDEVPKDQASGAKEPQTEQRKAKKKKDGVLDVDKLVEICLTKAHFEKALENMQPTVSPEAQGDIDVFAKRFNKAGSK